MGVKDSSGVLLTLSEYWRIVIRKGCRLSIDLLR